MSAKARLMLERALAWGLLLLGLAALWLAVAAPIIDYVAAVRRESGRMLVLAQRYEAEAAGGSAALQRLRDLGAGGADASLLLPPATDAQSQSLLQERVKAVLAAQGGAVLSGLQPQPGRPQGPWRGYPLAVQFTADMPTLQKVLHAIETHQPAILVEALQVRSRAAAGSQALDIAVDLVAFGPGAAR